VRDPYPIGTPSKPWTAEDRATWRSKRRVQRSYQDEVLEKLEALEAPFELHRYGALSIDPARYPVFAVHGPRVAGAPWALVTGGVHGYETSGVQGALRFLGEVAERYVRRVNLVVAPCVSPWGYEVIHRWNPDAVDPNRSFVAGSPAQECSALMRHVQELDAEFALHIDLHETTDTDESEFRPALAARDGKVFEPGHIPDGFYLVGDSARPEPAFQKTIIEAVASVTHIAPADPDGKLIGCDILQPGVIEYPCRELGLCPSLTNARFVTTTEVYPDSPNATPDQCNAAQVTAVRAALEHMLGHIDA
jgi:hypothetical protein